MSTLVRSLVNSSGYVHVLYCFALFVTALAKGKHVFEIHWPRIFRGQTATVGVGNSSALMFIKPKDSLIGCNGNSWGLDISRRKLIHRGEMTGSMPRGMIPEK